MNYSRTAAIQPKAVSAGMLLLVGAAFIMAQLTSLVLGPAPSRQLHLSLTLPAVDLEEGPNSLGGQFDAVLGAVVAAVPVPARLATRVASPPSPARLKGVGSLPVVAATGVVNNEATAATAAPSVEAGHSRHAYLVMGAERQTHRLRLTD
jgi:hypothetical protein